MYIFNKRKEHQSIWLNSLYLVAFKNPRDTNQISTGAPPIHIEEAFKKCFG